MTGQWSMSSELIEVYEGLFEEDTRTRQRSTVSNYTERYVPLVEEDMLAEPVVAAGEDHIVYTVFGYLGGDVGDSIVEKWRDERCQLTVVQRGRHENNGSSSSS